MSYLLSIVIPTKNRYLYLKNLLTLIDSFNNGEIEVVIQDNSDDNSEFVEYLHSKRYAHLVYNYTKDNLTIVENSDLSIYNSSGEYVCFIGDDDGVTPLIIDVVKWMKDNHQEILVPSEASYYWPDYYNSKTGKLSGTITYLEYSHKIKYISTQNSLINLFKNGCTVRDGLPLLYHGIVRRKILDQISDKTGTFFPGPSPDMANGVALALLVDKYVTIDSPIIISGASKFQGGGARAMKNQAAELESLPFLPTDIITCWEKEIPRIWTAETIWAESAIKALRRMGYENLVEKIDYEYLYAKFSVFHYKLKDKAFKLSKNKIRLVFKIIFMTIVRYWNALIRLISRKFFNKSDGVKIYYNIADICEASNKFMSLIKTFKINE